MLIRTSRGTRVALRRCGLPLALRLLCCLPSSPVAALEPGVANPTPGYGLDQLALGLGDAPQAVRAELAHAALDELAAAYAAEAKRARRERRHAKNPDLLRWAVAVENLAAELATLAGSVTGATPVRVSLGPDNSVNLVVDGTPVEVNGPRPQDQAALERRVIERFCRLNDCERWISAPAPLQPPPLSVEATTRWSFSETTGPVCSSYGGLEFRFDNATDLSRKREACARVVAELNILATEIARHKERGLRVDWDALALHTLPGGDRQRVALNRDGDAFQAYLPGLAAAPKLVDLLKPWLIARVNGLQHQLVVDDAETLLPAVGFLGQ